MDLYAYLLFCILVASIVIPIRYIRAHTKDAPEKYFIEFGASRAIKDYYLSKIFLYCAIAVPIIFQVIVYLSQIIISAFSLTLGGILSTYLMYLFLISITLAIKLALQHSRNDFNFYLAKAYFMVGSQRQDDFEKFKALVLLLDTYNKFLERNLKLKIRDIMRIYSRIISASPDQKTMISDSIRKALEKDKLVLARRLAEISSLPDTEHFLTREPRLLNQRFKDILTIIIPAIISIPVSITVLLANVANLR